MSALGGLVAVDISTGIGGPLAAQFLADYGADVIRVEPPGGDQDRSRPGFHWLYRGKRSVVLDSASAAGRDAFAALLAVADVCVTDSTAQLRDWGVADVAAACPRLIVLETPLWVGEPDPYTEIDTVELLAARTGLAWNQSSFAGGPVELVEPQVLYVQGAWAACATIAALTEREASGRGQTVCVSGVHAFVEFGPHLLIFDPGKPPGRRDFGGGGPNPTYTRYQCADGSWVFIGALGHKFQRRVVALLGLDEILDDPRIAQDPDKLFTPDNCDWVRERMETAFAGQDRAHWLAALEEADVPSSPLLERSEWFSHEHVRAMGMRAELSHPVLGELLQVASPIRLSATPARPVSLPPDPGADQALLDKITSAAAAPPAASPTATTPAAPAGVPDAPAAAVPSATVPSTAVPSTAGPLAGIRVLSLGAYVAGPQSARMLGLLGADVIKVENPAGDPWRMHGFQVNLGMRGLALDITDPAGKAAFCELVKSADVVLDNFRPGVLERLGLDDASLRALNPAVITGSVTGFGSVGPMARRPGFDPVLQAISGMQIAQGGDDEPVMLSFAVNDTGTAALTALGATIALLHRARTGQGQRFETSLAATSLFLQGGELASAAGQPPARTGGRDFRGPDPWHRYYQCTDGWIRVEGEPAAFPLADLADLAGMTVEAARAALARAGVRTMRVHNAQDLVADPVLMGMGLAYRQQNEDGYAFYTPGQMALFSRTVRSGPERPPGLGEHSTEVLAEAGIPAETIDGLLAAKVVVQGSPVQPRVLTAYR